MQGFTQRLQRMGHHNGAAGIGPLSGAPECRCRPRSPDPGERGGRGIPRT
jgi:hypothetical protein